MIFFFCYDWVDDACHFFFVMDLDMMRMMKLVDTFFWLWTLI